MTAPRSLSELANVILLVREATAILDLESSLQGDTAIEAVADNLWDLYNQLLDIRDLKHTETGHGYSVKPTITITNTTTVEA